MTKISPLTDGPRVQGAQCNRPRVAQLAISALFVALAGCAAPPAPRTTVVLLPNEDGSVGTVMVTGPDGPRRLEQAYGVTTVGGNSAAPAAGATLPLEVVRTTYRQLMQAQPSRPQVFVLYFTLGKTELTAKSKAQVSAVLATARARKPTEILVFGHTDALGSNERNVQLSAERAQAVVRLLQASDPSLGKIDVRYFGSKDPSARPGALGSQPKNRRAEVMIL